MVKKTVGNTRKRTGYFQLIIGRTERIDIVDAASDIPSKIDTGAFRSAIHAQDIKVINKGGKKILTCRLLGHPCSLVSMPFETRRFNKVSITNSFGKQEERYEINLRVKLGPKIVTTSFTLADRSNNLFPVLIGRKLLKNRFIVDVAKNRVQRLKLKKDFGGKLSIDAEDLED